MANNQLPPKAATAQEKRAFMYKAEADELLIEAQGYEHEGDAPKAAAAWGKWTAKRAEIRAKYPD